MTLTSRRSPSDSDAERSSYRRSIKYTTQHTTAEVLEAAALLRIPAGPLLNGSTVTEFEQFVARSVFVPGPSGRFLQPRIPYRVSGEAPRPFETAPDLGQHDGLIDWAPRRVRASRTGTDAEREVEGDGWRLPLAGVRVVDCTAWWAGPITTAALAALGADVIKVESLTRPDNMRFASTRPPSHDRWWEWGPIFHAANIGKRGVTFDLSRPEGAEMLERLLRTADILVENFTPRVMEQFGFDWDRVHALNDELIMVRMPAFGLDGPWRDRTGFAQTMECLTGMSWLTGFAEGPPVLVRGACDPLGRHARGVCHHAGPHRAGSPCAAEGWWKRPWSSRSSTRLRNKWWSTSSSGTLLGRDGNRGPYAAPQGVYPCAGDDEWIAVAVASDEQWRSLRALLGSPSWMRNDFSVAAGRRAAHDAIDRELSSWTRRHPAEEMVQMFLDAGIPSAVVVPPRDIAANPQLRHRRCSK
jgi:crotonobetainyl-CoA:carnitine CoA-transferase CaiB-like acyl-CoA transferase